MVGHSRSVSHAGGACGFAGAAARSTKNRSRRAPLCQGASHWIFTAMVTPVEVAFLDEGTYVSVLWVTNRVVDFCFIIDIILTFNLAYQEPMDRGGHWIFQRGMVARNYLVGWFFIDLVSVLPFWLITLKWDDAFGANADVAAETMLNMTAAAAANDGPGNATRSVVLIRIVKLLRMLKLARVLKASRVMQRALLDFVMNQWEWTYAVLRMIK